MVDCAEAAKVMAAVDRHGLKLVAVLPTHYHFDHVGGNEDIVRAVPNLRVYGARGENGRIPAQTHEVDDGGTVEIGSLRGRVIGIPAHTNGHIAYYFPELKAVFTGDTLFIAGCGRVFEGKAQTMVELAGQTRRAARRHASLLRPRIHREEPALRPDARARQRRLEEQVRVDQKNPRRGQVLDPVDYRRGKALQPVPAHRQSRAAREPEED